MNKLFQELQGMSQATNNLKAISNPKAFVQQYVNSPQVQNVISQYGSPKNAFYALARQKGISPDEILNQIR